MLTVDVLISTMGVDGIRRVAKMNKPSLIGLRYIVSWQKSEGVEIPSELNERDDVTIVRNPGIGLCQNRNYAFKHSSGDIMLIADDDLDYDAEALEQMRKSFEENPTVGIGLFRYKNQKGGSEKKYPDSITEITGCYPKGYYVTSFEIAIRRGKKSLDLSFCEEMGIGAPVLKCGEEELFIYEARKAGLKVVLFPYTLCIHAGETTGVRSVTDLGVYRGIGAGTALLYPFSFLLRFILVAYRGQKRGKMKFLPAIVNFIYGAFYLRSRVLPGRKYN